MINGVVAPGPSLATLTFSTGPILNGTTLMELNRTNAPNPDRIMVSSGPLSYDGALIVTNIGPELQGGENFQLFHAGIITGSFTSINLPALGANLVWDTKCPRASRIRAARAAWCFPGHRITPVGDCRRKLTTWPPVWALTGSTSRIRLRRTA